MSPARNRGRTRAVHLAVAGASALILALHAPAVSAGDSRSLSISRLPPESMLRQALQDSCWPPDLQVAAEAYLRLYPQGTAVDLARQLRDRVSEPARILSRSDVHLYRAAFEPPWPSSGTRDDVRHAALGDAMAAARLAQASLEREGPAGSPARYVGWLQYAALLGNEKAAYDLAVYFRAQGQPLLASQYEARAVSLGFVPPRVLDHVRK